MSSIPQTTTEQTIPVGKRSDTVIMGRLDFLSVLSRSIGGELYKLRQRAMSKILLLIAIFIMIITFLLPALGALANDRSSSQVSCTIDKHGHQHCTSVSPQDPARQAIAEKVKETISAPLRLPNSLSLSITVINFVGTISLIILTGSIVGSEYGIGTIRLMLTRGPTRTQFFLAKIGSIIICILITLFVLILVGIIVGALFNLTTGIAVNFSFFTGEWVVHAILYVLIAALGLSVYAMIALCLATLGKTTAAGIAGALIWWFLESVLGAVLTGVGFLNQGPVGDFLDSIPDYFIGNNLAALYDHQNHYLINGARQAVSITNPHDISDIHAMIVLTVYLVAFIGIAWWANQQRDVTN
jgi:ABC-type transport system involved in multi-copper enzyme maturation permease subunit